MSDEELLGQAAGEASEAEPVPDAASDDDDLLDDQADLAEDFLNGLLDVLDMDGEAEADFEGDTIAVSMTGPDMAVLIGRHGATLEALQELTRAAVAHASSARAFLTLDIDGYRQRQRERLEGQARQAAERARSSRQPVRMEPMSSFERKVVHDTLHDVEDVMTESEGEDPERYVVIRPV